MSLRLDAVRVALLSGLFLGITSTKGLPGGAIAVGEREMKNRISIPELSAGLGHPSSETVQSLRLWKAFIRLSPSQRAQVLAFVEELASDPAPRPDGVGGGIGTR